MEEGKRMRECKNEGVGQGRVVAGGRGVVNVGVSSKKGCRRCGCAVEEGMSSHVERKEIGEDMELLDGGAHLYGVNNLTILLAEKQKVPTIFKVLEL